MPETAAHEATTGEEIQAWYDAAWEEYEAALAAYMEDVDERRASGDGAGTDPELLAEYEETRDNLVVGVQYWRQVGEQVGTRLGVLVVDEADGTAADDTVEPTGDNTAAEPADEEDSA